MRVDLSQMKMRADLSQMWLLGVGVLTPVLSKRRPHPLLNYTVARWRTQEPNTNPHTSSYLSSSNGRERLRFCRLQSSLSCAEQREAWRWPVMTLFVGKMKIEFLSFESIPLREAWLAKVVRAHLDADDRQQTGTTRQNSAAWEDTECRRRADIRSGSAGGRRRLWPPWNLMMTIAFIITLRNNVVIAFGTLSSFFT